MTELEDTIVRLSRQLMPTGRAFRIFSDSFNDRLYKALARSEADAWNAANSVLTSLLPDNPNFTADDATDWERRLGLISNPMTPLTDRMAAISRKMAAPGRNPAKGHYLWIQQQLQDAGFTNLFVYENIPLVNPAVLNPLIVSDSQHGEFQHGGTRSKFINHIVVNSLDNKDDIAFDLGSNLRSCFLVGAGPGTPGTYANVLQTREKELRQLLLTLKQVQNAAILYINYI